MPVVHIAICDDEREQLALSEQLLREYGMTHPGMDFRVDVFSSGAALLEHLRVNGCFDIYLLDILMPDMTGIELGLNIRKTDPGGQIVYLTSSPDYAIDSYLAKASQYLLKPVKKERLFRVLDDAIKDWLREHQAFITIKTRNGLQRASIREVVYGELVGHCVQYHLADGIVLEGMTVRTSFREAVSAFLEHDRFLLCAASFFVNLSFVEMIEPDGLKLVSGGTLPISRALRTEVTNRWLDYHLKGGTSPC